MTPTQRTLKELRKRGCIATIVEKWNPHSKTRHDAFGMFDLLAIQDERGIVGIQCTSGNNVSARIRKIVDERSEEASRWLRAKGFIEVWGWRKAGQRGKRKLWQPRVEEITLQDFE